ncbi:D12 class N6 adenine-specific DNA methyltransferase domain protein [Burkholderia pseudomallei MSHR3016]|nr:D12 class N6 adenine-specific DNA methyltransferase domain protein [Burkholderia pseudomallei MSHR3016]
MPELSELFGDMRPDVHGGTIVALRIDAKPCRPLGRSGGAKTHLGTYQRSARSLNRFVTLRPGKLEFLPGVWRQGDEFCQTLSSFFVAKHTHHIHYLAVEIVIDLAMRPRLSHEYRRGTAIRLYVSLMRRKMSNDPRCQTELATVIPKDGTRNIGHTRHSAMPRSRAEISRSTCACLKIR